MSQEDWQRAGLTNLNSGKVETRIPPGRVLVPGSIELEADCLVWHMAPDGSQWPREVRPSDTLLNAFVRLADAPPEGILRFARTHGVLGLDASDQVASELAFGREPIERWRSLSARARSVLNVAAAVQQGNRGSIGDWEILIPVWARHPDHKNNTFPPATMPSARSELARAISDWMRIGRVSFGIEWNRPRKQWQTEIDFAGMFNALALQLMLAVAGMDLFLCDGCHLPYGRSKTKKRPKAGWLNFCEECGRTEAVRQADRRRKQKMAEVQRLHAERVSPREIAAQLDTKPATVRGWLKKAR